MRFCRIVTIALATVILAGSASTVDAQVKIGVVDLQRAINETEDGRQAKRRLKKVFDERQKSLNDKQESLKAQKESLERQQDVLSKDAFQKKVEKYQADLMELQNEYVQYQQELSTKEAELTQKILEKMQTILRRIGQTDGRTSISPTCSSSATTSRPNRAAPRRPSKGPFVAQRAFSGYKSPWLGSGR
jgi:outer membrane protein